VGVGVEDPFGELHLRYFYAAGRILGKALMEHQVRQAAHWCWC
jgi:hypothetical protein